VLLVIGNKNYSSWSLRPWLALKVLGIPFEEKRIPLYVEGSKEALLRYAEAHPQLWPAERAERARARAISAEMHSGFPNLREHMSMNVRKRYPGRGRTPEVLAEIGRVLAIWSECRGPFLFGPFTAADAMYAPVVLRFRTYEVALPERGRAYADAVLGLPAMREWIEAAERETESLPRFDQYG
jgi:glutathione S-transferase